MLASGSLLPAFTVCVAPNSFAILSLLSSCTGWRRARRISSRVCVSAADIRPSFARAQRVCDSWFAVFGNHRRVEVEIGPGRGDVFLAWAASAPATNFFAIERSGRAAEALRAAAVCRGLDNVRVVAGGAECVLAHGVAADSVDAYHIYFPDPWPKTGHRHRRLFGGNLAGQLRRTLVPGGAVHLASDLPQLVADLSTRCVGAGLVVASGDAPVRPTTVFERKYARGGTFYVRLARPANEQSGFRRPTLTWPTMT